MSPDKGLLQPTPGFATVTEEKSTLFSFISGIPAILYHTEQAGQVINELTWK